MVRGGGEVQILSRTLDVLTGDSPFTKIPPRRWRDSNVYYAATLFSNFLCSSLFINLPFLPSGNPSEVNKVRNMYSMEYTDISKLFVTTYHLDRCCMGVIEIILAQNDSPWLPLLGSKGISGQRRWYVDQFVPDCSALHPRTLTPS